MLRERADRLTEVTIPTTRWLCEQFGIKAEFVRSSQLKIGGSQTGRLVNICRNFDADRYLTGPAALDYLDLDQFARANIAVEVMRYEYGEYPQLHPGFTPDLSSIDLLLMTGRDAKEHLKPVTGPADDAAVPITRWLDGED